MSNNITTNKYTLAKDLNKIFGKEVLNSITIHGSVVQINVKEDKVSPEVVAESVDTSIKEDTILLDVEVIGEVEVQFDLEHALSIKKKKELDLYCTPFNYELDGRKSLKDMKQQLRDLVVDKEDVE